MFDSCVSPDEGNVVVVVTSAAEIDHVVRPFEFDQSERVTIERNRGLLVPYADPCMFDSTNLSHTMGTPYSSYRFHFTSS